MSARCFASHSAAETHVLGRALGRAIEACESLGLVVALEGELGAGKTVFVKGLADGLGLSSDQVSSPTFVIAQQYVGPGRNLHHIDLYRIDDASELEGFGFDELLDPPHVAAVEWSNRFEGALPPDRLVVRIERSGDDAPDARRVEVDARGERAAEILDRWAAASEGAG